jgi:hypothetical protein
MPIRSCGRYIQARVLRRKKDQEGEANAIWYGLSLLLVGLLCVCVLFAVRACAYTALSCRYSLTLALTHTLSCFSVYDSLSCLLLSFTLSARCSVSEMLPFLQYDLHKQLFVKLQIYGMNAIFNVEHQVTVGEDMVVATISGTAIHLRPLPQPPIPHFEPQEDLNKEQSAAFLALSKTIQRRSAYFRWGFSSSSSSSFCCCVLLSTRSYTHMNTPTQQQQHAHAHSLSLLFLLRYPFVFPLLPSSSTSANHREHHQQRFSLQSTLLGNKTSSVGSPPQNLSSMRRTLRLASDAEDTAELVSMNMASGAQSAFVVELSHSQVSLPTLASFLDPIPPVV